MSTAEQLRGEYEAWLRRQVPVIDADLDAKHHLMSTDVFAFFRATYYLWLVRVSENVPEVLTAIRTPIAGDLHAENFGTWRDADGALRWGVNDLDELARGPWLLDLLRLATSAAMSPHIDLRTKDIADLVLDAYATATPAPSPKVSDHKHLASLVPEFKDPDSYFTKLQDGPEADSVPVTVTAAALGTAPGAWSPTWYVRQAGAGSLGHRRVVGVGRIGHAWSAREAKQLDAGTAAWARTRDERLPTPAPELYSDVARALEAPLASMRVDGWQLRALAPDEVRIELSGLAAEDAAAVLQAMAAAAVAVQGVDRDAQAKARKEAAAYDRGRFRDLVKTMKQTIQQDFENSR